jgi:mono/diheme cytochrome c family protein
MYATLLLTLTLAFSGAIGGALGLGAPHTITAVAHVPQQPDGAKIYAVTCQACHQANGLGLGTQFPPLVGSEWVTGREDRLVLIILHGITGEIEVEGEAFNGLMPTWGPTFGDADVAAVATYVRSAWGNKAAPVSVATVTRLRAAYASRTTPWTVAELQRALAK